MQKPQAPSNEEFRLSELRSYDILDTQPESVYDNLTKLLAETLDVPVALVSLVDSQRQWFKSKVGIDIPETPREISFCGHVVESSGPLIVADASCDQRFSDNPLVNQDPNVRFYAGWPLQTHSGVTLGTLCALDSKPKILTSREQKALELLANQVVLNLELRRKTLEANHYKEQSEHKSNFLATLTIAQQNFISGKSIDDVFEKLFTYLLSETKSSFGFICAVTSDQEQLEFKTQTLIDQSQEKLRESMVRWLYSNNDTVFLEDHQDITTQSNPKKLFLETFDLCYFISIPIKINNLTLGIIALGSRLEAYDPNLSTTIMPLVGTCATLLKAHNHAADQKKTQGDLATTARKLAAVNGELTRSNEDLEQFAYIVSHDLQAPLRHIKAYTEILAQDLLLKTSGSAETQHCVTVIHSSVVRLQSMISDILAYSSVGHTPLAFSSENLSTIISEVLGTLQHEIDTTQARIFVRKLPTVRCDAKQLSSVLQNLLQNALTYHRPDTTPQIEISARGHAGLVVIAVEDNGMGIPPEDSERIFKMFQRLPQTTHLPGTGIGLAICKKIIERHGGRLWIEHPEGGGCRFCFSLLPAEPATQDTPL